MKALRIFVGRSLGGWSIALACAVCSPAAELADLEQQAINAAADAVADAVVQIRTVGGLDQLDQQSLAQGPTTGLIISTDGYIVSSAFNFVQEPTSILVRLPNGQQRPAEIIGRDANRMLVLLKVDVDQPLPVAEPAPAAEIRPGDWAIALGRTYRPERVSISVGVVSAVNRMHGRAVQTDANVSTANYGGPLVDLQGRVIGVLVPMAPQAAGASETNAMAGAEFYDSGIGFAVPLIDILGQLDRWTEQKKLERGLLGVGLQQGNPHSTPPILTAVWPRSPAAAAGWKPKDRIIAVEGVEVETQTDLRFQVAPRYAGDTFEVTIRRGSGDAAEELETEVTLADKLPAYRHAFLGVLPSRDDSGDDAEQESAADEGAAEVSPDEEQKTSAPDAKDAQPSDDLNAPSGIVVRAIWPDSPADKAGLRAGDRITRLGEEKVASIDQALGQLNAKTAGDELPIAVRRGDESLEFNVELTELPTDVLASSDLPTAGNDDNGAPLGDPKLSELKLPEMSQTARYFQPPQEGPVPGLLVWLGDGKAETAQAMAAAWQRTCTRDRLILLMPQPGDAGGWSTDDVEYLARLLQTATSRWGVDPQRIILAGEGKGGQLAYALAFRARKMIRGVAVVDSPLPRTLQAPENSPNERLAVLSVETQNSPLSLLIRKDLKTLAVAGYPATQLVRRGEESRGAPLDATTRAKIARWIDGLDRF